MGKYLVVNLVNVFVSSDFIICINVILLITWIEVIFGGGWGSFGSIRIFFFVIEERIFLFVFFKLSFGCVRVIGIGDSSKFNIFLRLICLTLVIISSRLNRFLFVFIVIIFLFVVLIWIFFVSVLIFLIFKFGIGF